MEDHELLGSLGTIITGTAIVAMLFVMALTHGNDFAACLAIGSMLMGWMSNTAIAYGREALCILTGCMSFALAVITAILLLV